MATKTLLRIQSHKLKLGRGTPVVSIAIRCSSSDQNLPAYVHYPYSYAFGRSQRQLEYTTIGGLLSRQANREPGRTAIVSVFENIKKNFGDLDREVNNLATQFNKQLGIQKGDIIAIWSCNSYNWIVAEYAAAKLGAVLCTVNPVYQLPELEYALRKANIKSLIMPGPKSCQEAVNKFWTLVNNLADSPSSKDLPLQSVVTMDGEIDQVTKLSNGIKVYPITSLQEGNGTLDPSLLETEADRPATIMFTSGTTGKPKGALNSHLTMVNNALLTGDRMSMGPSDDLRIVLPLPLFHSFALTLGSVSMSAIPCSIVMPNFRYDVKMIVEAIKNEGGTHTMCTPTMIIDILNYVEKNQISLPTLRGVLIGGAPMPVEVAHRIERVIPSAKDVRIGYGATELGPCTTASLADDSIYRRMETVGSPLDFVEIKIVNPTTNETVKIGEQGELLSRGHNVMLGYFGDEAKTREAIDEARWYKSGDLATMDQDGYVKIVGRTKEMIIRGGENIYPREIEEVLHLHPDIFDAYVVGVPDERQGEEVCAWIKVRSPEVKLTEKDIKEFCKDKLAYFKIPRYVLFVDGFPLTSTGKAQKFIMREKSCELLGLKELKR